MEKEKVISPETKIVFSIKMFISTIVSIISIFVGFYVLAVVPKFNDHKENIKSLDEKIDNVNIKLMEINNGIGIINGNITGINNRFGDLNQIRSENTNSGGSLGN